MEGAPEYGERVAGVMLGTAVGDALGLPAEGLSRERIARRWGGEWRHRFLFGRGMLSDDTEHTLFVAQAILDHPRDVEGFRRSLAWKLRWWLAGLPAGVGMSTLRASFKLWLGWPAHKSGVFSAGNGPAMRAGIIGAAFPEDAERREAYVRASTLITHTDPRALTGSLAVAEFVASACQGPVDPSSILRDLRSLADAADTEWPDLLDRIEASLDRGSRVVEFAADLGLELAGATPSQPALLGHSADARVLSAGADAARESTRAGCVSGRSGRPYVWLVSPLPPRGTP